MLHNRQVSILHGAFIFRDDTIKITISTVVEVRFPRDWTCLPEICQNCLSLIVANIPVVITTTVDIIGEADDVCTRPTARFSSTFWPSEAATTGDGMELYAIDEEGPPRRATIVRQN